MIMQAEILLTLKLQQRLFADPRRIALLKQIEQTGSISQGQKTRALAIKAPGMRLMK
jgi:molybdate transport system regulatory protein